MQGCGHSHPDVQEWGGQQAFGLLLVLNGGMHFQCYVVPWSSQGCYPSPTSDLGFRAPVVTALLNSCGSTEGLTALRWSGELPVAWDTCSGCPCYLEGFSHHSVVMSFCIKAYVCHTRWWGPLTEKCSIRSESYSVGRYKSSSVF